MAAPNEGQDGRTRERPDSQADALRGAFSERARKACESLAGRLRRIVDPWEMPVGLSTHLKSPGYMDLVVERLTPTRASLTHYGKQNGDLMKDPDMEIELDPARRWVRPMTYQNDYAGVFHSLDDVQSPRLERDLAEFFATWLKNLDEQGFGRPSAEEAARRKAEFDAFLRERLADIDRLRGKPDPFERERPDLELGR